MTIYSLDVLLFLFGTSLLSPVKVKVAQSCPTLCSPMDYTVHGILQAKYWSVLPFPFPGNLPNPGIEPWSPALQADSLPANLGKVKVTQLCPTLWDPWDHTVHGILQAKYWSG